jgi:hypothetical protein
MKYSRTLLAVVIVSLKSVTAQDCSCSFTILSQDELGCKVYGTFNNQLIGWNYADSHCLREYNVSYTDIDRSLLHSACPFPNETDAYPTDVVNLFRPDTPRANALKAYFSEFFMPTNSSNISYVFQKVLVRENNRQVSCASAANCWNELVSYFSNARPQYNANADLRYVCKTTYDAFSAAALKEQITIRADLCNETKTLNETSSCHNLYNQIKAATQGNTTMCATIMDGPAAGAVIPPVCTPANNRKKSEARFVTKLGVTLFLSVSAMAALVGV